MQEINSQSIEHGNLIRETAIFVYLWEHKLCMGGSHLTVHSNEFLVFQPKEPFFRCFSKKLFQVFQVEILSLVQDYGFHVFLGTYKFMYLQGHINCVEQLTYMFINTKYTFHSNDYERHRKAVISSKHSHKLYSRYHKLTFQLLVWCCTI